MREVERKLNYVTYESTNGEYKNVYTMVNMGDYVGFLGRSIEDKRKDNYMLLFLDGFKNEKEIFHAEGFVSEEGKYIGFLIETKEFERVIKTDGEYVLSDVIYVKPNYENMNKTTVGYQSINLRNALLIEDYLKEDIHFVNPQNEEFKTEAPLSKIIELLINKNNELRKVLKL